MVNPGMNTRRGRDCLTSGSSANLILIREKETTVVTDHRRINKSINRNVVQSINMILKG
jgi:hypothetical protein